MNDLWEWDPAANLWSILNPDSDLTVVPARSNFGFTTLGDSLFIFGGQTSSGRLVEHSPFLSKFAFSRIGPLQ